MKFQLLTYLLINVCLISCHNNNKTSIIQLSDFTKELISLYINDSLNYNVNTTEDDVIITSISDSSHYFISIFTNNSKLHKFCRDDFVGQTTYSGYLIRIFGEENNIFFSINEKYTNKQECKNNYTEYSHNIWQVCLYKDKSFCKLRTYRVTVAEDISAIQSLAEKYFTHFDTDINSEELFQNHEVEIKPRFLYGEDSLLSMISSNFNVKQKVIGNIPVVVDLVIDKEGRATLKGIGKSSEDIRIDNEAIRVANIICQYEFLPASHRKEKVNAIYPVIFMKEVITP